MTYWSNGLVKSIDDMRVVELTVQEIARVLAQRGVAVSEEKLLECLKLLRKDQGERELRPARVADRMRNSSTQQELPQVRRRAKRARVKPTCCWSGCSRVPEKTGDPFCSEHRNQRETEARG